jgi:hypothetical protein
MTPPAIVRSVVKRHMKWASPGSFTEVDIDTRLPVELSMNAGEIPVGWYRNPEPWQHCFVVFTSEALYAVDGMRTERIALDDLVGHECPRSKTNMTGVRVLTKDGVRFVRIAGSSVPGGAGKDGFCLIMVIQALCP